MEALACFRLLASRQSSNRPYEHPLRLHGRLAAAARSNAGGPWAVPLAEAARDILPPAPLARTPLRPCFKLHD